MYAFYTIKRNIYSQKVHFVRIFYNNGVKESPYLCSRKNQSVRIMIKNIMLASLLMTGGFFPAFAQRQMSISQLFGKIEENSKALLVSMAGEYRTARHNHTMFLQELNNNHESSLFLTSLEEWKHEPQVLTYGAILICRKGNAVQVVFFRQLYAILVAIS